MVRPFRTGDVVEVKSLEDIRATLDSGGAYEGVPFMPEMLSYCGRRFRVHKRADKICVERPTWLDFRRVRDTVLLEEVRCDGSAHDGCQKLCMILWKEAWLRPAPAQALPEPPIDWPAVMRLRPQPGGDIDEAKTYWCQSTTVLQASELISGWDLRQYLRDLRSGAFRLVDVLFVLFLEIHNKISEKFGGREFGAVYGELTKTPVVKLGLKPGDTVRVKSRHEIVQTLDNFGRNRGLGFALDMERHCARTLPVITPVNRMILETTGKMKAISNTVLLHGAACTGLCNRTCARNSHPLWREAWLERVESTPSNRSGGE